MAKRREPKSEPEESLVSEEEEEEEESSDSGSEAPSEDDRSLPPTLPHNQAPQNLPPSDSETENDEDGEDESESESESESDTPVKTPDSKTVPISSVSSVKEPASGVKRGTERETESKKTKRPKIEEGAGFAVGSMSRLKKNDEANAAKVKDGEDLAFGKQERVLENPNVNGGSVVKKSTSKYVATKMTQPEDNELLKSAGVGGFSAYSAVEQRILTQNIEREEQAEWDKKWRQIEVEELELFVKRSELMCDRVRSLISMKERALWAWKRSRGM